MMADEQAGVNTGQVATDQTGVNTDPTAEGQQASATETGEQQGQEPQQIPKERFDEVNSRMKSSEAEVSALQQQLALTQARQQVQQQTPSPADPVAEAIAMIDNDYATPEQIKHALTTINVHTQASVQSAISESNFAVQCPDYSKLVGQQNAAGKFKPAFQSVIDKDPSILPLIYSLPPNQQKTLAYKLASATPAVATTSGDKVHPKTAKALADAAIPTSPMAVSGGGALGKASQMATMSDEDFASLVDKHTQDSG